MKHVITSGRIPVKMWLDLTEIEEGALNQAKNLSELPFAFKHIAIMSDSHQGYGMPIGGVMATKGVIVPNAVGVDIGCSVTSVKTSLNTDKISRSDIENLLEEIKLEIPHGEGKYPEVDKELEDYLNNLEEECKNVNLS